MDIHKEKNRTHIIHPFGPLFDAGSRILILGSLPGVSSREGMFFYHHPQNRFWKVLAAVFLKPVPMSIEEKKKFLSEQQVALWDVIESCDIAGSSDASIRNVRPNDIRPILQAAPIRKIITNGSTSHRYYTRYIEPLTGRRDICCPSTSPANAAWSLERLTEAWKAAILDEEQELPSGPG